MPGVNLFSMGTQPGKQVNPQWVILISQTVPDKYYGNFTDYAYPI